MAATSYNKRKQEFRTFSPVNTREDIHDGVDRPLLDNHNTLPNNHVSRTLSPASARRQHTLPVVRTKQFGPEKNDPSGNTYQAGYSVDPDDINYNINEFMLSNCKEDVV